MKVHIFKVDGGLLAFNMILTIGMMDIWTTLFFQYMYLLERVS